MPSITSLSIDKNIPEALCLGMTDAQMDRCRKRLEQFLVDLLEPVGRSERRHWGSVYVRGLLLDGERKSVEPMSKRLPDGNEQAMQQFVGQSPWEWQPVPGISFAISLPSTVFGDWCKSPKHAGRSSRTISNSKRNSVWTT